MSQVNKLLTIKPVQIAVWKHFGIDMNCPLPEFEDALLYGTVSDMIHKPEIKDLIISNLSDDKCFYGGLTSYQKRRLREFDEYAAAAYTP
jgi:hypothetical protein